MVVHGPNGEVQNWNKMHDEYRESILEQWKARKGAGRAKKPYLVVATCAQVAEARRREKDQLKVRKEEREERDSTNKEKASKARKEQSGEWMRARDDLEQMRVQGIREQKEFNRLQRRLATQRLEEEQTAETLRARERREREREMLERELRMQDEMQNSNFRSEHDEQEASRKRKDDLFNQSQKARAEEAQRERNRRLEREKMCKEQRRRRQKARTEEIKAEYQKRVQELERTKEDKQNRIATRLKNMKDAFHLEADAIVGARNARAQGLEEAVRERQIHKRQLQEAREWARANGHKYLAPSGGSRSPSPHAMGHAPAPSIHHQGMGH